MGSLKKRMTQKLKAFFAIWIFSSRLFFISFSFLNSRVHLRTYGEWKFIFFAAETAINCTMQYRKIITWMHEQNYRNKKLSFRTPFKKKFTYFMLPHHFLLFFLFLLLTQTKGKINNKLIALHTNVCMYVHCGWWMIMVAGGEKMLEQINSHLYVNVLY